MFVNKTISLILVAALVRAFPAAADDIALSLVHGQDRIDIPVSAITRIEAHATQTFFLPKIQKQITSEIPYVLLCYTAAIQEQICRLTRQIVEQPMSIVVDCEVVSRPVVRDALCGRCLQVSGNDIQGANALAQRLKKGSNRRCAPVS